MHPTCGMLRYLTLLLSVTLAWPATAVALRNPQQETRTQRVGLEEALGRSADGRRLGDLVRLDTLPVIYPGGIRQDLSRAAAVLVTLDAGRGTRFMDSWPPDRGDPPANKAIALVAGKPAGWWTKQAAEGLGWPVISIVGHAADQVMAAYDAQTRRGVIYVTSEDPAGGTGYAFYHAAAVEGLKESDALVIATLGDQPLFDRPVLETVEGTARASGADLVIATAVFDEPRATGRIVRDRQTGRILGILEQRDIEAGTTLGGYTTEELLAIREGNVSIYAMPARRFFALLAETTNDNAQRQFYATDLVKTVLDQGGRVDAVQIDPAKAPGITTVADLERIEAYLTQQAGLEEELGPSEVVGDPQEYQRLLDYLDRPIRAVIFDVDHTVTALDHRTGGVLPEARDWHDAILEKLAQLASFGVLLVPTTNRRQSGAMSYAYELVSHPQYLPRTNLETGGSFVEVYWESGTGGMDAGLGQTFDDFRISFPSERQEQVLAALLDQRVIPSRSRPYVESLAGMMSLSPPGGITKGDFMARVTAALRDIPSVTVLDAGEARAVAIVPVEAGKARSKDHVNARHHLRDEDLLILVDQAQPGGTDAGLVADGGITVDQENPAIPGLISTRRAIGLTNLAAADWVLGQLLDRVKTRAAQPSTGLEEFREFDSIAAFLQERLQGISLTPEQRTVLAQVRAAGAQRVLDFPTAARPGGASPGRVAIVVDPSIPTILYDIIGRWNRQSEEERLGLTFTLVGTDAERPSGWLAVGIAIDGSGVTYEGLGIPTLTFEDYKQLLDIGLLRVYAIAQQEHLRGRVLPPIVAVLDYVGADGRSRTAIFL